LGQAEPADALRFLDILTTASSIARSRGADAVAAVHVLDAIAVLAGVAVADDVSGSVSPLARAGAGLAVEARVQVLTQRWFARLGNEAGAQLEGKQLGELRRELEALAGETSRPKS